jgi:hypothetical protein
MPSLASQVHPDIQQLALYSRKDLPWHKAWSIRRHLASCAVCRSELSEAHSSTEVLRRQAAATTLSSSEAIADWAALEREMLANIKVGLDAARCIGPARHRSIPRIRMALGACALFAFATVSWWMSVPREETDRLTASLRRVAGLTPAREPGSFVETSLMGISVHAQGATLTLLNPGATPLTVSLSGSSAVTASYVDDATGQVTITNVYGQ